MSDEDKRTITRQIRAGFVFLSGVLYEPPEDFWELPETFLPAQRLLEQVAREAGLGVLTHDERRDNWRQAVLKMKGFVEPHGIVVPGPARDRHRRRDRGVRPGGPDPGVLIRPRDTPRTNGRRKR